MLGKRHGRVARMQKVITVDAMHHVHVMTGVPQAVTEPVQIDGVSAKTVRRIESGQMQKVQWTRGHGTAPCSSSSSSCRAAACQVRRLAARYPDSPIRWRSSESETTRRNSTSHRSASYGEMKIPPSPNKSGRGL